MFVRLSALAFAAIPLVSALTINPLSNAIAGATVTITWTADTTDPTSFSILMVNPDNFHNTFAIANTVETDSGELVITLPEMPAGDGYSLQAIANNNVNVVYAQSSTFSVAAATSTTGTTTDTDSAASATDSATTTVAETTTGTLTSFTSTSTTTTSTSASPTSSSHTGGAAPLRLSGVVPAAALLLSAVAGAAMV